MRYPAHTLWIQIYAIYSVTTDPPICQQIFRHLYGIPYIFIVFSCTTLYRSNKTAPRCVASGHARVINVQENIGCISQSLQYNSGRTKIHLSCTYRERNGCSSVLSFLEGEIFWRRHFLPILKFNIAHAPLHIIGDILSVDNFWRLIIPRAVFLQELTVAKLVKKFPVFWKIMIYFQVYTNPPAIGVSLKLHKSDPQRHV